MSLASNLKCTTVSPFLNTVIGVIYQAYYMHDLTRAWTKNAEEELGWVEPKKKKKKKKERARMAKQSNLAGDPIRKNK